MAISHLIRLWPTLAMLKYSILILVMFAMFSATINIRTFKTDPVTAISSKRVGSGVIFSSADVNTISPGELPGYTGWARPENTIARSFYIKSISTEYPQVRKEFVITVTTQCKGHKNCVMKENDNDSLFFLRAYGPAVIPGTIKNYPTSGSDGYYDVVFVFYDPGLYTIEIVLTFSNSPPISIFPLKYESQEPPYEGYLLPGFPLLVTVQEADYTSEIKIDAQTLIHNETNKYTDDKACRVDDFFETNPTSAIMKARWVVTSKINEKEYFSKTMNSTVISTIGYSTNVNSLGINMEYKYNSNCLLIPESSFDKNLYDQRAFSQCPQTKHTIRIIYIGDSVLRVQKDMLQHLLNGVTTVKFDYLSLHGGYRRNQVLGPSNIESFLRDIQKKAAPNDIKVILFNTGLHDIHRLCGAAMEGDERRDYIDINRLNSGSFTCVDEYRALLRDFVNVIKEFPAQLKVFQSSTAAWPKYGNYGIEWKPIPQRMPLVSDFSATFNEIAYEVLGDFKNDNINIMDGYWITYPRPDNREIGGIGNKLSHPGVEVLSTMARKWAMLILDTVCHN